jgi:hypothetical protein
MKKNPQQCFKSSAEIDTLGTAYQLKVQSHEKVGEMRPWDVYRLQLIIDTGFYIYLIGPFIPVFFQRF